MEPFSLLAAAGAFLAAEAAKHVGGLAVEKAFDKVKGVLKGYFGRDPQPDDFSPEAVKDKGLDAKPELVEQVRAVVSRSSALRRAEMVSRALQGARALWVDDQPRNNAFERRALASLGMHVSFVTSTAQALTALGREPYDVVLSDMARDTPDAGLILLRMLRDARCGTEVVFYIGKLDPGRPTPAGAFGIADQPEPLFHLVFDVLERKRV